MTGTWLAVPPKDNELTEHDILALERMPVGVWFRPLDLDYIIRRREATCERLRVKGYLESRVVGSGWWEFRLAIDA